MAGRGLSQSVSHGEVAGRRHNVVAEYRKGLTNVTPERTPLNQVLVDDDLGEVYRKLFGEAVAEYDAAQVAKRHPERRIGDYLAHVRADAKLEPVRELVVQIGSRYTNPAADETCRMESALVYRDWLEAFERDFPHLRVMQAVIHMDETTPHLHVVYVPWVDGRRRGPSAQVSLSGAYRADGFADIRDANGKMRDLLEESARKFGIDRIDQGCKRAHMSVRDFKQAVASAELGKYPFSNDPRLVAMVEEQAEALEQAQQVIAEQAGWVTAFREVIDGQRPLSEQTREEMREQHEAFQRECAVLTGAVRSSARRSAELMDVLRGIARDWRNFIINPISEAMRAAREHFAASATEDGAERWRAEVEEARAKYAEDTAWYRQPDWFLRAREEWRARDSAARGTPEQERVAAELAEDMAAASGAQRRLSQDAAAAHEVARGMRSGGYGAPRSL